jgi:hypothetical protein
MSSARPQVVRHAVFLHDISQQIDHIVTPNLPSHMQREAAPREFVDQHQDLQNTAIVGTLHDEIPAPDVVGVLRSKAQTAAISQP